MDASTTGKDRTGVDGGHTVRPGKRNRSGAGHATKATAAAIKSDLTVRVAALKAQGITPGLGTLL
ncbi:hypothetical protein ACWCTD_25270, partial [Streptomyces sp. NPDC001499]